MRAGGWAGEALYTSPPRPCSRRRRSTARGSFVAAGDRCASVPTCDGATRGADTGHLAALLLISSTCTPYPSHQNCFIKTTRPWCVDRSDEKGKTERSESRVSHGRRPPGGAAGRRARAGPLAQGRSRTAAGYRPRALSLRRGGASQLAGLDEALRPARAPRGGFARGAKRPPAGLLSPCLESTFRPGQKHQRAVRHPPG